MEKMTLPHPQALRHELQDVLAPGPHEPSVIHFGCLGCPNSRRLVSQLLSIGRLVELMDEAENVPRAFIAENMGSIGKAQGCPLLEESAEPDCQHEVFLTRVIGQV